MNWIDKNAKNLEELYKNKNLDVDIFIFYPTQKKLTKKEKQKLLKSHRKILTKKKRIRKK
jgi:hypothetical protein